MFTNLIRTDSLCIKTNYSTISVHYVFHMAPPHYSNFFFLVLLNYRRLGNKYHGNSDFRAYRSKDRGGTATEPFLQILKQRV